jgi:serine/threonine protein kinase
VTCHYRGERAAGTGPEWDIEGGAAVSRETEPVLPGSGMAGKIADYRLDGYLGRGSMATVYLARDERTDHTVAVKVLAPELARDTAFRTRFLHESRAAAAVDHPNIIPVYDAGDAGGTLYVAMRYIQGGDARALLNRLGPLPFGWAWSIIAQVASALDAAHANGLIHRDVKPTNMLLEAADNAGGGAAQRADRSDFDHVYLSDFGISKNSPPGDGNAVGQVAGTLDYVAPEQVEGRAVDGRADLYSLACAGFELLCGAPPFGQDQGLTVMYAQLYAPPPTASARRPDLPPAVDQVLATALAKNPADRYMTCGQFAEELHRALGLGPGETAASGAPAWPGYAGQIADAGPAYVAQEAPGPAYAEAGSPGETWAAAPHDFSRDATRPPTPSPYGSDWSPPKPEPEGQDWPGAGPSGAPEWAGAGQIGGPDWQSPQSPGPSGGPEWAGAGPAGRPDWAGAGPAGRPDWAGAGSSGGPEFAGSAGRPGFAGPAGRPEWADPAGRPEWAGGGSPAGPGRGQQRPRPSRPTPSRTRLMLGAVGTAIVVIAVVVAFVLSRHSAPGTPLPHTSSSGPSSSASAPASRQASAIDTLLTTSAATRKSLVVAIRQAGNCVHLPRAVARIQRVVNQRSAEYNHALALSTAAMARGATVKSDLIAALRNSLGADRDYLTWARQQLNSGCTPTSQSSAYQAALSADRQADSSKAAFVQVWNSLAARYGVRQKSPGEI